MREDDEERSDRRGFLKRNDVTDARIIDRMTENIGNVGKSIVLL